MPDRLPAETRAFIRRRAAVAIAAALAAVVAVTPLGHPAVNAAPTDQSQSPDTTTVPAFVDHHVHVFNVGWWLLQSQRQPSGYVMAGGATSESAVVARARGSVEWSPPARFVTGFGWSQDAWGTPALPSAEALSHAVPRNPVALARTDGHALWVNSAALRRAGLR